MTTPDPGHSLLPEDPAKDATLEVPWPTSIPDFAVDAAGEIPAPEVPAFDAPDTVPAPDASFPQASALLTRRPANARLTTYGTAYDATSAQVGPEAAANQAPYGAPEAGRAARLWCAARIRSAARFRAGRFHMPGQQAYGLVRLRAARVRPALRRCAQAVDRRRAPGVLPAPGLTYLGYTGKGIYSADLTTQDLCARFSHLGAHRIIMISPARITPPTLRASP